MNMAKGDINTYNEDDTWKTKVEGSSRAAHTGGTKAEQQAVGRDMTKDRGVEHTVRNLDGTMEQDRIRSERTTAERDEARLTQDIADVEQAVQVALDVTMECARLYGSARDHIKRLFNQVFFERVLVHTDETITVELNEPFATIASTAVQLAAHEEGTTRKSGARALTSFLEAEIGAVAAFFLRQGF
jgi:hypothetical protein